MWVFPHKCGENVGCGVVWGFLKMWDVGCGVGFSKTLTSNKHTCTLPLSPNAPLYSRFTYTSNLKFSPVLSYWDSGIRILDLDYIPLHSI